jgi:hypothetical protein
MIAVIASSTAPRLPASLQDLGSSPKEAKKTRQDLHFTTKEFTREVKVFVSP